MQPRIMRCKPISYPWVRGLTPNLPRTSIRPFSRGFQARRSSTPPPASYRAFTQPAKAASNPEPGRHDAAATASSGSGSTLYLKTPGLRKAYVAMGSNMGDRIANIDLACDLMDQMGVKVTRTSSLWETDPMYVIGQAKFLNAVCEVETSLDPIDLLDMLQSIENNMGRVKVVDKGPRIIDLDIVMYEKEIVNTERLKLPHALAHEREFVLRPLAELCPSEPLNPQTPWKLVADYLEELPPSPMPMTTVTPVAPHLLLRGLDPRRKTHIMGIINMTPDSFSGDGLSRLYFNPYSAIYNQALTHRFEHLIRSGATILDIGGQSTRPNAPYIPGEEEKERVLPAIAVARNLPSVKSGDVAVSIDTFSSSVAFAALGKGTHLLNDVSAGTLSGDRMLHLAARKKKTIVLMHMRGNPVTMGRMNKYTNTHDPLREKQNEEADEYEDEDAMIYSIAVELLARIAAAEEAGVRRWHIILDPGLGFAKHGAAQNVALLRRLPELREWPGLSGLPWMVGPSRKSFLSPFVQRNTTEFYAGKMVSKPSSHQRVWATAAAVAASVEAGADIVRVHDVRAMSEVAAVSDGIWRGRIDVAPTYTAPQHDDRPSVLDGAVQETSDKDVEKRSAAFMKQLEDDEKSFAEQLAQAGEKSKKLTYVRFDERPENRQEIHRETARRFLEAMHQEPGPDGKAVIPPPSWKSVSKQISLIYGDRIDAKDLGRLKKVYKKIIETSPDFTGKPTPPSNATTNENTGRDKADMEKEKVEATEEDDQMVREAMKKPVARIQWAIKQNPQKLARTNLLQEQRNRYRALVRAARKQELELHRRKGLLAASAPSPPGASSTDATSDAPLETSQTKPSREEVQFQQGRILGSLKRDASGSFRGLGGQSFVRTLRGGVRSSRAQSPRPANQLNNGAGAMNEVLKFRPVASRSSGQDTRDTATFRPGSMTHKIRQTGGELKRLFEQEGGKENVSVGSSVAQNGDELKRLLFEDDGKEKVNDWEKMRQGMDELKKMFLPGDAAKEKKVGEEGSMGEDSAQERENPSSVFYQNSGRRKVRQGEIPFRFVGAVVPGADDRHMSPEVWVKMRRKPVPSETPAARKGPTEEEIKKDFTKREE
ncbi:hypothetical protein MKZ38_000782 [Zalerion maritima]|uniref:Pterin-binding domain-containing protein n=1 Tax=Zalerion maritima TaxID=339359 RepID=A0AAD5WMM4_9PEZI|nr:hypothetical protein MKZ38_000782 [Zalerion maritima]